MGKGQSPDEIRKFARDLGNAIETRNTKLALSRFADDCEIEFLEAKLTGEEGVKKWLKWLYENLAEIRFSPATTVVEGNVFFEEYILYGKLHNGAEIQSKQASVSVYEGSKIKSLHLYFDRFDFAELAAKGFAGKRIVKEITKKSLKGLV